MSSSVLRLIVVLAVLGAAGFFVVSMMLDSEGKDANVEQVETDTTTDPEPAEPPEKADAERETVKVADEPERNAAAAGPVLQVEAGTGTMSGVVVNMDRAPVEGAKVTLAVGPKNLTFHLPSARKRTDRTATTAADGTYTLEGLAANDNYIVIVEHPEYALSEAEGQAVRESDFTLVPDIVLDLGGLVRGSVKGPNGIVIAGATVELWDTLDMNFKGADEKAPWKSTTTDSEGNFTFKIVHFNACEVVVSADGYATTSRNNTMIFAKIEDRELNFELSLANSIQGVVVDERGQAIAGVKISGYQIGKGPADRGMSKGNAVSADDGRFTMQGLAVGNYNLSARMAGYSDATHVAAAGSSDARIVMQLRGGVSGVVRERATGAPVTDFEIRVLRRHGDHEPSPMGKRQRYRTSDGSFNFPDLDPFNYVLEGVAKGYAPGRSEEFFVQRGNDVTGITIELDVGASLSGVVVDSAAKPVAGALVKLNTNNFVSNPILDIFGSLPNAPKKHEWKTKTKKDGTFQIDLVVPGTYQIEVSKADFSRKAMNDIQLQNGQTVQLGRVVVSSGGFITGTCKEAAGQPFSDGTIHCQGPNGSMKTVKPDYDGRFDFKNLEPGSYKLTLQPDKMGGSAVNPLMKILYAQKTEQTVQVREGAGSSAVLSLPPPQ